MQNKTPSQAARGIRTDDLLIKRIGEERYRVMAIKSTTRGERVNLMSLDTQKSVELSKEYLERTLREARRWKRMR